MVNSPRQPGTSPPPRETSADATRPVAVITGSGRRRVGNVVADYLADRGYDIALHYHSAAEEAQASAAAIRAKGVDCEAYRADVSVEADVDQMFAAVLERFRHIDVLVTAASVWDTQTLESFTAADVLRSFNVNTLGTLLCARRAGLAMCTQPAGGVVITIGDWAVERPYLNHPAYFIAKGAIPTLTRMLAVEFAQRNPRVRANCIHPGNVMFPPDADHERRQELVAATLTKNPDCPESVAQAVVLLVKNQFATGICMPIDGGRTIFANQGF